MIILVSILVCFVVTTNCHQGHEDHRTLDSNMTNLNETWPTESPHWMLDNLKFLTDTTPQDVKNVSLNELQGNSDKFPIEFPINTTRCKSLKNTVKEQTLERNINSAYPVVHEKALSLFASFISHKRRFGGTDIERNFYKNMTLEQFIDRLLNKKAAVFYGREDNYMLLDGTKGAGHWETIGKSEETPPLVLQNCLSYDELKLSALLSVSSYTYFINLGDRSNNGLPSSDRSNIQDEGVIIGLIGPRFEKPLVMEYQDVVISKEQNTHVHGYGQFFVATLQGIFLNFYGDTSLTYEELRPQLENDPVKYTKLAEGMYFNNVVYERRLALTVDTLLVEANHRAGEKNTKAYVHVVGVGLGVWKISPHQVKLFMDVFAKRIQFLSKALTNISDICFSHIKSACCGKYKNGETIPIPEHPLGGIKIHISNREPHEKLEGADKGKLLVVSYPGDGNALPGNVFWEGELANTGDPAAASSTQIAELHNAHINSKVSGDNLRIVTLNGLLTLKQYQESVLKSDK